MRVIFRSHLSRDFRGHLGISGELYMQRAGDLYRQRALTDNSPRSKIQHFFGLTTAMY